MWHSRVASETGGMCWYTKISSLASACRRWSTVLKFAGKLCPAMLAAGAVEHGWPRRYFFFGGKSLSLQRARFVSLTAPVVAIALARDHGCRKLLLLASVGFLACVGLCWLRFLASVGFSLCWLIGSVCFWLLLAFWLWPFSISKNDKELYRNAGFWLALASGDSCFFSCCGCCCCCFAGGGGAGGGSSRGCMPGGRRCAVPPTLLKSFEIFDMKFYDSLWCCFVVVCYLVPCL